ncbi:MAG: hypothetical protein IKZ99_05140 [Salinivirgaceae bacterium]|nr:hypothetical protein [Salinivirgaceae bacterium]
MYFYKQKTICYDYRGILLAYIEGIGLTASEKQWLANKLREKDLQIEENKTSTKKEGLTGLRWLLEHPIGESKNL